MNKTTYLFKTLILAWMLVGSWIVGASAQTTPYYNSGDNTNGFIFKYDGSNLSSDGTVISGTHSGGWDSMPVFVNMTENFQISFDVYNNSFDGDSHFLLFDPTTNGGLDIRNSPLGTDTPNINIFYGTNFVNHDQFYFPTVGNTLATASTTSFANQTWTHVTISKTGNILTDNVNGQIIQADLTGRSLPATAQLGLGYYSTTFSGGTGIMSYRDITVLPEPSTASLLAWVLLAGATAWGWRRRRAVN